MRQEPRRNPSWPTWPSRWIERTQGIWGLRRPRLLGPPARVLELPRAGGIENREKKGTL